MTEPETTDCGLCGRPTTKLGTRRCDRCYELETRIEMDPELARLVLSGLPDSRFARVTIENAKVYRIRSIPTSWDRGTSLLPNGEYTLGRVRS